MAKPRIFSISTKSKVQRVKAFLRVLKYSTGGVLEPANIYKLKHLSKIEVVSNDPSGCTFTLVLLGFDNLRNQSVAPPHWTMRNIDDRNRLVMCMFNICKDVLGRIPKVVGIDVVEMALWAKPPTDVADPKYADILLLENYAAFQNSVYDLANVVPTLAKFYHQTSESYEQACTRHISVIIYYHFERLFQFARKIEDLMYTITPEEIPFQLGLSQSDLRKVVKSSLSGVDKSIMAMYKKSQKNLTSEELLPSLWDKCKKEFLDKYDSFAQLVAKIYPSEHIPTVSEMRDLLASM